MASGDGEGMPDREQMMKVIETAQAAQKAQSAADVLKSKANDIRDPAKRDQLLQEAFEKEVEANGHSKMAKRLQSGTWQGMGFGGGIGAATGLGLGAGIGTVLGAITAIPFTGLGMLAGSATGAIHGPWVKLGGKEQKFEDADPEEVVDALEQEQNTQIQGKPEQPPTAAPEQVPAGGGNNNADQKPRRKPKKLEVRSQQKQGSSQGGGATGENIPTKNGSAAEQKPRKKPKKLEVRSKKSGSD